jgi:hypothetical protein
MQLAKLRSHFHKDVRKQLYGEAEDKQFFESLKQVHNGLSYFLMKQVHSGLSYFLLSKEGSIKIHLMIYFWMLTPVISQVIVK